MSASRMPPRVAAFVVMTGVALPGFIQQPLTAADAQPLVQIETKRTDNAILYMKATELKRGPKTSKVKVEPLGQ